MFCASSAYPQLHLHQQPKIYIYKMIPRNDNQKKNVPPPPQKLETYPHITRNFTHKFFSNSLIRFIWMEGRGGKFYLFGGKFLFIWGSIFGGTFLLFSGYFLLNFGVTFSLLGATIKYMQIFKHKLSEIIKYAPSN